MKSNNNSALADYINIVNRPGMMDSIAEGFSAQARNIPNLSPGQRRVSGFLTGFGAGMKGVADQQRASKLAAMEEASRQLAEADINLRFQDTALNATRAQAAKFTLSYKPEFLAYAEALKKGDQQEANNILKIIGSAAGRELTGFKEKYGEFDHAINGKLFFTNANGQTIGYGQKELFSQLPFVEVFGDDAQQLDMLLSDYTNTEFKRRSIYGGLKIQELEADIANKYAYRDLHGAQAREANARVRDMERVAGLDTQRREADIRNVDAQTGLYGTHSNLYGAQSEGIKSETLARERMAEFDKQQRQADIANTEAHTGVYGAQADLYNAQAQDLNKTPVNKDMLKKTYDTNVNWLEKQSEAVQKAEVKNIIFDRLEKIIKSESAAGGSLFAQAERHYKKQTGKDAKITEARNLQKYFFPDIKGVAGNPNLKEWDDLIGRLVSVEQNTEGALATLAFERKINNDLIQNYNYTNQALKERDYGALYTDPEISGRVKQLLNESNKQPAPEDMDDEELWKAL